jgi:dihydroflavonol-4-reductase
MRIGVTGASGMVGINVCKEILSNGDELNILIREDVSYLDGLSCNKFYGDLSDIDILEKFCDKCDVIIHSAAMISIGFDAYDQVYEVNFVGTKNLLDTSIKKKVKKFIFISTVNAYDKKPIDQNFDEKRELVRKGNAYDMTKALAQQLVTSTEEIETVSINPTSVLGKNDFKPSRLGKIIKGVYSGKLPFLVDGGLDVIDVEDLSKAIYSSISNGRDGESYLISGKFRSFKEIYEVITKYQDKKSRIFFFPRLMVELSLPLLSLFPIGLLKRAAEINGKFFPGLENMTKEAIENIINFPKHIDNSKAKKDLGLKISPLEKTIKDTIYE